MLVKLKNVENRKTLQLLFFAILVYFLRATNKRGWNLILVPNSLLERATMISSRFYLWMMEDGPLPLQISCKKWSQQTTSTFNSLLLLQFGQKCSKCPVLSLQIGLPIQDLGPLCLTLVGTKICMWYAMIKMIYLLLYTVLVCVLVVCMINMTIQ